MKVIECNDYNQQFPEKFQWGTVDSYKMSSLASILVAEIDHSLRTDPDRTVVAGIRTALNRIAELTDY